MADLTITAANVQKGAAATAKRGTAGATITAGMPVQIDPADGLVKPAANTSEPLANCRGIALHAAASGQPIAYVSDGPIDLGATLVVGMPYVVSAAGLISPITDATTADFMTILGVADATDNLNVNINASGVALAADID